MSEISVRELRNNVSSVLRRVEAGERLNVTVNGRPVAELTPLSLKASSMNWEEFIADQGDWSADGNLALELVELIPDTTDDIPIR